MKLSVPLTVPSTVGVKVTLTVHVLPTNNTEPQLVEETAKFALAAMSLMVSVAVPQFFSVTVLVALVVSITWFPKPSEVGESVTVIPVPNTYAAPCAGLEPTS